MVADFEVTPWEVSGKIDYDKLIREFGLQQLHSIPKEFEKSVLFRRGDYICAQGFETDN